MNHRLAVKLVEDKSTPYKSVRNTGRMWPHVLSWIQMFPLKTTNLW